MTNQDSGHNADDHHDDVAGDKAVRGSSELVTSGVPHDEFGDDFRPEAVSASKEITLQRLSAHGSWDDSRFEDAKAFHGAAASAEGVSARRMLPIAAMIAIAAIVGAAGGVLASAGISRFTGGEQASVAMTERHHALESAVAKVNSELATIKASVESSAKASTLKLAKLNETLDRLKAPETTGSIAAVPAPVAPAAAKSVANHLPVPAAPAAPKSVVSRLPVVEGWVLRDVAGGGATVEGRSGLYEVYAGDPLPGLGRVDAIRRQDGRWVVVTSRGLIVAR